MPLLTTVIGAVLGAMLGHGFDAIVGGGFIGLIAGLVFNSWRRNRGPRAAPLAAADADPLASLDPRVAERLRTMERRIATLEKALQGAPIVSTGSIAASRAMPATERSAVASMTEEASDAQRAPESAVAGSPVQAPAASGTPVAPVESPAVAADAPSVPAYAAHADAPAVPAYAARAPRRPAEPRAPNALWRFVAGGNTLARIGVVVLFIGVAFLLKYATEHVTIPIEIRLAGVAVGAVALLALGWRLRTSRAGYAMSLQGAAIGVLYLTVFAALRLYALLPPIAAFTLLFWIAALSSFLAIRQDAMALAILGVVGGFAAPVLTSSGGGSHLMLFSYYAVLNAGIFAIAWFKAWRLLNVVGFACTFLVGTLWGVTRYRPEDFATTEPFLILFFLFYVGIATLYAVRRSLEVRRYVDAALVFGTPLIAAGLQGALVRRFEYGMAWSALGAAATYLLLARWLYARHRDDLRLLVESFLALGVVFATLAVPLALDARLTSATWALEGAALVWVGTRQQHVASRAFGLLLQFAAGIAFALGFSLWTHRVVTSAWPLLNSDFIGAALVALAALVSARVLALGAGISPTERTLVPVVFGWGVLWWAGAGWQEIERFVGIDARISAFVVFLAATAGAFAMLARRLDWLLARVPSLLLSPALFAIAVYRIVDLVPGAGHLFAAWGWLAWPSAIAVHIALLRHFERVTPAVPATWLDGAHAILAWLVTLIAAHEFAWLARSAVSGEAWRLAPWALAPVIAIMAIVRWTAGPRWPMGPHVRAWLVVGAMPLVVAVLAWSLYANVASNGDAAPLPFFPLFNPLDLAQAMAFVAVALWLRRAQAVEGNRLGNVGPEVLGAAAAALLLFWVTFATLRTLHHWADVPWSIGGMWGSRIVQAALALVWSIFALGAMVVANRRRYRGAWVAGAALLAIVVAKLFFVDLSQVGGVERIVSFIGVGVLLLVVGYLAPVPPRHETT